jgi:hypothetical protein
MPDHFDAEDAMTRQFSYQSRVLPGLKTIRGSLAPGFGSLIEILKSKQPKEWQGG